MVCIWSFELARSNRNFFSDACVLPTCVAQPEEESDLWVESSATANLVRPRSSSTKYVGREAHGECCAA